MHQALNLYQPQSNPTCETRPKLSEILMVPAVGSSSVTWDAFCAILGRDYLSRRSILAEAALRGPLLLHCWTLLHVVACGW